jgi:alpha-1,2-mannosyltransferase
VTRGRLTAPRRLLSSPLLAGQLAVALACGLLLRARWATVHELVVAVDHGDVLFADFVSHYYPTVSGRLRDGPPVSGFFYPAGFAALLAPLSLVGPRVALVLWGGVQLGCLGYVATALVQAAVPRRPWLALLGTALTATSVPVLHNLKWGQVSVPILAVTGAAFVMRSRGKLNVPAALLGVAASIKGYPLVFLGWFVLRRDVRLVLRGAAACALSLVVLPALVMGPSHALFFQRVSFGAVRGASESVLADFNSQCALAVLGRHLGGWDKTAVDVRAMGELATRAALALTLALVVLVSRSSARRIAKRRALLAFVLVGCTVPFWLHTSWSHYFVHLPLAQVMLVAMMTERGQSEGHTPRAQKVLVLAVLVAPSVWLSSVVHLFAAGSWWAYASAGSLFYANALLLMAYAGVLVEAHVRDPQVGLCPSLREPGPRWGSAPRFASLPVIQPGRCDSPEGNGAGGAAGTPGRARDC